MAGFSRGLGLILVISVAATDPSATRVGSQDANRWWEIDNFADLIEAAQARRAEGDFAALRAIYTRGYERALARGNRPAQLAYLSNLGTARMVSLQYASALDSYLKGSSLAEALKDWVSFGAIAVNLSRIYQRMGDSEAALSVLERANLALDGAGEAPPYRAQLLMNLRAARADLDENAKEPTYLEVIEAARQGGDPETEATAWDLLGREQTGSGQFDAAEASCGRALRLRAANSRKNLSYSYAALGALRLEAARRANGKTRRTLANDSEVFTNRAILTRTPSGPASYVLVHQRGLARELSGWNKLALEDFRDTVIQAENWNVSVPPAPSLINGANTKIQHEVFDSFIPAAARWALKTGDDGLAAEAFLALESNRAASLLQNRQLAQVWREKLPRTYWETLAKLNQEKMENLLGRETKEAKRLHLVLTEMESKAGTGFSVSLGENFRNRNSLIHFQQGLGDSDLFLSFYLGRAESYLWVVTRRKLAVHSLPAEAELRESIRKFRRAVIGGSASEGASVRDRLGLNLYQRLFGSLDAEDTAKSSWFLSLDKELFELPFAALVAGQKDGAPIYFAERHTSRLIPGAMFLAKIGQAHGGYVGVADAVYNAADPRRAPEMAWAGGIQMNRLVNSSRELRRSVSNWRPASGRTGSIAILEGTGAGRDSFLRALQSQPETIHLATHVLSPQALTSGTLSSGGASGQAFLVFSPDARGQAGLLSTRDIGMLHVPGALVVMSGCATATGDARAGAGLLGLTRAWLMAGASAVMATNWPIPDADGDLIPAFYRNLRQSSPAEALQKSQVEMIHSGTWEAAPGYWAAFQVTESGL